MTGDIQLVLVFVPVYACVPSTAKSCSQHCLRVQSVSSCPRPKCVRRKRVGDWQLSLAGCSLLCPVSKGNSAREADVTSWWLWPYKNRMHTTSVITGEWCQERPGSQGSHCFKMNSSWCGISTGCSSIRVITYCNLSSQWKQTVVPDVCNPGLSTLITLKQTNITGCHNTQDTIYWL